MYISSFPRFFAWLVEIFAQFFLHLDLTLDTLGLFAANGIRIRLSNGYDVVSDLLIVLCMCQLVWLIKKCVGLIESLGY